MRATRSSPAHTLEEVGRLLLGSVTSGGLWVEALEAAVPHLGCFGGTLSCVMPPRLFGVPTRAVTDTFEAIAEGRTPPLTASTRMIPNPRDGFLCDQMEVFREPRDRSPFYLDFIRPRGLAYQASAYLDGTEGDVVNLMLFRGPGSGGFEQDELRSFSVFLPYIRAATMASRARLQFEADRCAAPFVDRGEPVLHVANDGTIRPRSDADVAMLAPDVTLRSRRLATSAPSCQKKIDVALSAAVADRRPSLITLTRNEGNCLRLLFLPVLGQALDVFHATVALVVVLDSARPTRPDGQSIDLLASAAGLTRRETEVTRLVASGCTPRNGAVALGISYETVRLHLKSTFSKLGVHSQAELTALVSRL